VERKKNYQNNGESLYERFERFKKSVHLSYHSGGILGVLIGKGHAHEKEEEKKKHRGKKK